MWFFWPIRRARLTLTPLKMFVGGCLRKSIEMNVNSKRFAVPMNPSMPLRITSQRTFCRRLYQPSWREFWNYSQWQLCNSLGRFLERFLHWLVILLVMILNLWPANFPIPKLPLLYSIKVISFYFSFIYFHYSCLCSNKSNITKCVYFLYFHCP